MQSFKEWEYERRGSRRVTKGWEDVIAPKDDRSPTSQGPKLTVPILVRNIKNSRDDERMAIWGNNLKVLIQRDPDAKAKLRAMVQADKSRGGILHLELQLADITPEDYDLAR